MAAKRMLILNSSFRQVTSYNLQDRCYDDLPHLGEAGPQHPPLVIGWNPGSDSQFAGVLANLYEDRGWRIHKQSIFLPGRPLEAISAAI
jgi:hypothetical protein